MSLTTKISLEMTRLRNHQTVLNQDVHPLLNIHQLLNIMKQEIVCASAFIKIFDIIIVFIKLYIKGIAFL